MSRSLNEVFDHVINEKEVPINSIYALVYIRALLLAVSGAIFGIQGGSVAIALTLTALGMMLFASHQLSEGGILRSNTTVYQASMSYTVPQAVWFSIALFVPFALSALLPTTSYLSLLAELDDFMLNIINFDLAPFLENAFLIVLGAVFVKMVKDSSLSNHRYFDWRAVLVAVALAISYIFVRLHGLRTLGFALFAGTMMFIWFYSHGYEDLTRDQAFPVLVTFMTFYSVHRANNIGSWSNLYGYYESLYTAPPEFQFLFWIVFLPDLLMAAISVLGTALKVRGSSFREVFGR